MDDQAIITTPEQSDIQATDSYIEQRKEGETPSLATSPEAPVPATSAVDQQAVDAYLEERKEGKRGERRGRGGAQARMDALTKRTHIAEEKAKVAELEAEAAKAAPKPAIEILASRPALEDFENVSDFHAAAHLWAVKEEKAHSNGAAPAPPPAPAHLQVRKQEFDLFLEKGKRFVAGHSDFSEVMQGAAARGLTLSSAARTAITSQAVPEVAYFLARPENDVTARSIMQMDDFGQVIAISRIAERLAVKPTDFISNAPAPGIRLTNGSTRSTVPIDGMETDDYIRQRAQEKRAMRGRR